MDERDLGSEGKKFLDYARACLETARELCAKIKESKGSSDPLPALDLYNDMEIQLSDSSSKAGLLQSVHPDEGLRNACEIAEQEIVALSTEFSLDRDLYEVFAALDMDRPELDTETKRLGAKILRDFKRSGVDRDEETRERIKKLNEQLTEISQRFGRAIREDTRYVEIDDPARLAGLPEDFIAAHPANDEGLIRISTNMADYFTVITYADDDALREELWRKKLSLGYPSNEATIKELLDLRHQLATTLSYANYAELGTEELMIKTPTNAGDFIEKVADLGRPGGERDIAVLLKRLKKDLPDTGRVMPWQGLYLVRKIKEEQFAFNSKDVRPYFEVGKVLEGILAISSRLFGIRFIAASDAELWHESVMAYDVVDGERSIGRIYLDLYPRDNKYKHAAMFPVVAGLSGRRVCEGAIVCNFPDPAKNEGPALLEHNEVTTFFHEFGHLLHQVLAGEQKWLRYSGVATEWDFVEVPSQLFEEWAWDVEMLQSFAINADGEPIPEDLVARMRGANEFGKGQQVMQQMAYASISLGLYNRSPEGLEVQKLVEEKLGGYSMYPYVPNTHFECGFGHLVEYASNYYTYMWSLVIVKDIYQLFKEKGLDDKAISMAYRKAILAPGGSKDADDLVQDFMGRKFSFEAFREWLMAEPEGTGS